MSNSALASMLHHLMSAETGEQRRRSDRQLLELFLARRDQTAFAALIRRHGRLVLSAIRRVLTDEADVEDAFQATFLVLLRKASSVRWQESIGNWLFGVAHRIAVRARSNAHKRHLRESAARDARAEADAPDGPSWREAIGLLHEELDRLPESYRMPLLLCYLDGKTRDEAAQTLRCSVGSIKGRLERGREMLRKRLIRRGLTLSGAMLAGLVDAPAVLSASPSLIRSTMQTAITEQYRPAVMALMKSAMPAVFAGKMRIAVGLLLAASLLAIGGGSLVALHRRTSEPLAAAKPPSPPAEAKAKESIAVRGRVVDSDGKPIKGARLHWPRVPKTMPKSEDDIEIPKRAETDADGHFRFELPRSDIKPEWRLALIAAADGYGVAWAEWSAIQAGGELTMRLVKDHPITGRILSTEGKPLAGVRVSIMTLGAMSKSKVDAFLTAWKKEWQMAMHNETERLFLPLDKVLKPAMSDKDGRFRVTGAGAERLALLRLRGKGVGEQPLYVVNRAGFDPAAVNKAVLERIPAALRLPGQPPLLYGPTIAYVAPAGRRIEGVVREVDREAGSGKPVAGYTIHIGTGYGAGITAISDKEGRYHLDGVPKMKQYLLTAEPPWQSSWLRAGARFNDTEGLETIKIDFLVARGVVVSGRVIDRATGKGVKSSVRFVPLPGNKLAGKPGYDSYKYESLSNTTDNDGRFKLAIIPGTGVLMAQVWGNIEKANGGQPLNPFKQAEFDAKDRERVKITENGEDRYFTSITNSIEFLSGQNAVKVLDFAPDAGTARCDLYVERGRTMTVKMEDADGKPLKGTTVVGITATWPTPFPINDATCTVFALDPKKPRRLIFYHSGRKLGGTLTVRGDEKEPPRVQLHPTGSVIGRLLERDGQPLVGAYIDLSGQDIASRELYRWLDQRRPAVRTDKDGRFRIDGVIADVKFGLGIRRGRGYLVGEPRIGQRQVKSGETLDLGDVRTKPQ